MRSYIASIGLILALSNPAYAAEVRGANKVTESSSIVEAELKDASILKKSETHAALIAIEGSINDLFAQLAGTSRENRQAVLDEHSANILTALSELHDEVLLGESTDPVEMAKINRLTNAFTAKELNRYLMTSTEYTSWLAQSSGAGSNE